MQRYVLCVFNYIHLISPHFVIWSQVTFGKHYFEHPLYMLDFVVTLISLILDATHTAHAVRLFVSFINCMDNNALRPSM